jgi:mevalonate kinase
MMQGRAPGKVLLFGEHAVVYGHPAIAAAVPRFLMVGIEPASEPRLELPGMATPPEILTAVQDLAAAAGFRGAFRARVQSEIPLGSGLGSSAALGVALARAFKPGCSPDEAMRLAMHVERALHGAPSGVDPAACAHGGVLWFVRGEPPAIEPLPAKLWLCVALTGIRRGTRSTVMPLAERRRTDPRVDALLQKLGGFAREARQRLLDLPALGRLMDQAHAVLSDLGVSCAELEDAVRSLRSAGALGAKLTGAGGGGAAIGLAQNEAHARAIASKTGGFAVEIGSP